MDECLMMNVFFLERDGKSIPYLSQQDPDANELQLQCDPLAFSS